MANLDWNPIGVNFSGVNTAMGNAQASISQAGTVFGNLRKSILDEEQKAIDSAFRERAFNENVAQFGLTQAIEKDKMLEASRHNLATEQSTLRGQDLTYQAQMADVKLQQEKLGVLQQEQKRMEDERNYKSGVVTKLIGDRDEALAAKEQEVS